MNWTETQKTLLHLLLDKYEKSATYRAENQRRQTFSVSPDRLLPSYYDDCADVLEIEEFEQQMLQMEEQGLVTLRRAKNGELKKFRACPEQWERYRAILDRRDKKELIAEQLHFYESWQGVHPLLDGFCAEQILRLQTGKKPLYRQQDANHLLRLCTRILRNGQDLLERELSISVLGDSKAFEKKYRDRVCRLLLRDPYLATLVQEVDEKRERESILLGEYGVYTNPSYIYLKGNGTLRFSDGYQLTLRGDLPAAFLSSQLLEVRDIEIAAKSVVTVENLTSFNRVEDSGCFYIFLSGYHNTAKQEFIKAIAAYNPGLTWQHFGDIDPDGFLIVECLCRGTGIPFQPLHMGVEELTRFRQFTKPLETNDLKKAASLMDAGKYVDVLQYMLEHNVKLEQEIVSWQENAGSVL